MTKNKLIITRTVWILSLVSLFTDVASEMLYPVMPIYLKSIGFTIVLIGVLEGFAEALAGISKGYFGKLSDHLEKRLPFIRWGYFLSALSKPMMAVFTFPAWIFSARSIDRLGKGIRTGARDALLSDEAMPQTKASVFGFHRSMDTLGAVFGPVAALIFLYFYPGAYKPLFYLAFLPGMIAISFSLFLKDKKPERTIKPTRISFFHFLSYWKSSPQGYRKLVFGLLLFTLFNSSDVFLLLKLKENGLSDTLTIGAYIFYNLVYAAFAFPLGKLADRLGLKKVFLFGLLIFAIVYLGMALTNNIIIFFIIFFLYGIYAAATEGISKAWISNITEKKDTATAIGTFTGFQSICTMIASSLAGIIWFNFGASTTFIITAVMTGVTFVYVFLLKPETSTNDNY